MRAMRRLARASIWHPGAVSAAEGEVARDIKRWALPIFDVLLIMGSVLALAGGMPSVVVIYNPAVSGLAALAVLAFSVGCLVGVAFPRWWALEIVAKCGLAFVLLTYSALLFSLAFAGGGSRGFVAGVCAACAVLPVCRIVWLGREYRRRALAARLVGEANA